MSVGASVATETNFMPALCVHASLSLSLSLALSLSLSPSLSLSLCMRMMQRLYRQSVSVSAGHVLMTVPC